MFLLDYIKKMLISVASHPFHEVKHVWFVLVIFKTSP